MSPERNRPPAETVAPALGIACLIDLRTAACGISLGLRLHLHSKHAVALSERVPVGSAVRAGARASAEQAYHRYQVHLHGYLPLPWLTAPGGRPSHGEKEGG